MAIIVRMFLILQVSTAGTRRYYTAYGADAPFALLLRTFCTCYFVLLKASASGCAKKFESGASRWQWRVAGALESARTGLVP
jgi:hypothetical protein